MRSTISRSRSLAFVALSAVALVAAACSSSGGASAAPSAAAPSVAAPSVAPSAAAAGPENYVVATATGALGTYIAGEDGKTLYIFTPDSANKSTCVDTCAATWPPFVVATGDTFKAGTGVTGALTTFTRPDGKTQVAINGLPLYYYGGDTKAGDTNGQNKGGKWFVVTPAGAALNTGTPSAAPSSSTGGKISY